MAIRVMCNRDYKKKSKNKILFNKSYLLRTLIFKLVSGYFLYSVTVNLSSIFYSENNKNNNIFPN